MAYTAIDDPEAHFQIKLYTGNGTNSQAQTFSGAVDMQPDLVWIKQRSGTSGNAVTDVLRPVGDYLATDNVNAEQSGTNYMQSLDSNGFSPGLASDFGASTDTYVAWCWKGGGTGVTNTVGTTTTTVSANTDAGFSGVTYTGTGINGSTNGHGLGAVPEWIINKKRNGTSPWQTYVEFLGNAYELYLDRTDGTSSATTAWNTTTPASTVWTVGTDTNNNVASNMVSYVWAPKKGYSKFGQYIGNGNSDGTFVYTGFTPAWVLIKQTNTGGEEYYIYDNMRLGYNEKNYRLQASATAAEYAEVNIDLLCNGFKALTSSARFNGSGSTYGYWAFAEAPLVNSNGVPSNARASNTTGGTT